MPLKIDLRAGEKLYIGNSSLLVACDERSTVIIDGALPVVRERDFVQAEDATSPLGRLACAVQAHYLSPSASALCQIYKVYFEHRHSAFQDELVEAMRLVTSGEMYKAIRQLRSIRDLEK